MEQLLEELLDSGGTPEEACRDCPELLPQVTAGWKRVRALQAEVGTWFPKSPVSNGPAPPALPTADLPRIRGYEVQGVLGHGGMGVVYKAWHPRLNRVVALKMLLAGPYARPEELERFLREAEAVAGLCHANIVQLHDLGELDGRPYFTMEYVEGGSLTQKQSGMPQPAAQAAALLATLAEAIHVAHQKGIVHRDLTPTNILLTADGTPKITDFGLARLADSGAGLTITGVPVGTPSYMAPEQCQGQWHSIGPATDVYALGAIFYELLTGRPPFRAETAAETLRQVVSQDPVPPSRLNAAVPRDPETICLKCLEKDPQRRYANAAALAEDLHRFLRGEPTLARPVGHLGRGLRWVRRHPTGAALVATALALVGLAIGGGGWLVQQRAERRAELRSEVGTAVAQAASLRKRFHFGEALELLEQARQLLEPAGPDDLREQVVQARADLDLVENLDRARRQMAPIMDGNDEPSGAEPLYELTLAKAVGRQGDDSAAVAARVRGSAVRAEIVAALDDWASITRDPARRAWLLAVARQADPDPSRDRLRQPELWRDGARLTRLVQEMRVDELSPQLLTALSRVLLETDDGEAVPLLSAAQARYPQDFWLNFELGRALYRSRRKDEALGFCRAALALRPEVSLAHNSVGVTLAALGREDEGIRHLRQAVNLDPNFAWAHTNLGNLLRRKGRLDEAIGHYQESLRLDQTLASTHCNLGSALRLKGRLDEAIRHLEESIRLDPKLAEPQCNLGVALKDMGRLDEAIGHYQEAIRLAPKEAMAHHNLGLALLTKGRLEEAVDYLQQAVRLDSDPAVRQHLYLGRYAAACAAVRTSGGHDSRAPGLGEAERVGLRRQALDWLRANLELWTEMLYDRKVDRSTWGQWPLAAWQTDPALAGVRDRAALAKLPDAERAQWQRLWADVAALRAADPLEQGRAHVARREWEKAADCYARDLKRGATDEGHFRFEYAAVLLLSGDRSGYANACAHMVKRCGTAPDLRAYHVARACTLVPDAVVDAALPGRLAEAELKANPGQFWSLTEQGALHYRAGRFPEAVELF
ncbi:MAG TPA: tetratricopeptide repeat protein, partial [Gemmataceae bacterium]|nr:tetratricopeptide repeat protein [Gemmataceae bacterium]